MRYGNRIFHKRGIKQESPKWRQDRRVFEAWCEGRTKCDFVNANMRELAATGFMSNRGRQNVASYLVHDLGVDWRLGASWFEHHLLDHDPASNYGNWIYLAGVGNDPRPNRKFNTGARPSATTPTGNTADTGAMRLWNLTYNDPRRWAEVHAISGKPLGFWASVKAGGTGSPRAELVGGSGELDALVGVASDRTGCNFERTTHGAILYFRSRLEVYGAPFRKGRDQRHHPHAGGCRRTHHGVVRLDGRGGHDPIGQCGPAVLHGHRGAHGGLGSAAG